MAHVLVQKRVSKVWCTAALSPAVLLRCVCSLRFLMSNPALVLARLDFICCPGLACPSPLAPSLHSHCQAPKPPYPLSSSARTRHPQNCQSQCHRPCCQSLLLHLGLRSRPGCPQTCHPPNPLPAGLCVTTAGNKGCQVSVLRATGGVK